MELRHGNFAINLPDDWEDRTTLLLVAPSRAAGRPTKNPIVEGGPAVSINFLIDDHEPRETLSAQATQLQTLDCGFATLSEGPFTVPLGPAWHQVQRLQMDGRWVRQLVVACKVGPLTLVASAAAIDERFDHTQAELTKILQSMHRAETARGVER